MNLIPFDESVYSKDVSYGRAVQVYFESSEDDEHICELLGFSPKDRYLKPCVILSEIINMPGHYVVLGKNDKLVSGIHGNVFYVDIEE